jgi:hypothetical protein
VRTALTAEQVAWILHYRLALKLGTDVGTVKMRFLLWSPVDNDYFVILQDTLNGDVITLLPIEYHENLAYKIDDVKREYAKRLLPSMEVLDYWMLTQEQQSKPSNFFVNVLYTNSEGLAKAKQLFSCPITDQCSTIDELIKHGLSKKDVERAIASLEIDPSSVTGLSVRMGRKGNPLYQPLSAIQTK